MTKQEEVFYILKNVRLGELTELEATVKLHELGVVIKVDRDNEICACCEGVGTIGGAGIRDCCPDCNGTGKVFCVGYVAVESLIKV